MSYDGWEHYCFTSRWIMNNFPPITDFHYFEIMKNREKEFKETLEFFGNKEYNLEIEDYNYEEEDNHFEYDEFDEFDNSYSSSESEYEEFEYI